MLAMQTVFHIRCSQVSCLDLWEQKDLHTGIRRCREQQGLLSPMNHLKVKKHNTFAYLPFWPHDYEQYQVMAQACGTH